MNGGFSLTAELDLLLPITALLPLTAILLVSQANPYQTLVLRGILGSVATLIYALLGAPDVALTEALVGTLLSTTLYAVALRSSMALRLEHPADAAPTREDQQRLSSWIAGLNLRLRLVPVPGPDGAPPEPQDAAKPVAASHGRWGANRTLVLHHPALHRRLRESEGYAGWLAAGGNLQLKPPP